MPYAGDNTRGLHEHDHDAPSARSIPCGMHRHRGSRPFRRVSGRSRKRLLEKQFRQRQTDHGGGAQTSRRAGGPAGEP